MQIEVVQSVNNGQKLRAGKMGFPNSRGRYRVIDGGESKFGTAGSGFVILLTRLTDSWGALFYVLRDL